MKSIIITLMISSISLFAQDFEVTAEDLKEALLLHYKLDGDVKDSSLNNYHGILYGAPSYQKDRFSNPLSALSFDGIDDFVALPNLTQLKPDFPITISFDIKYESDEVSKRVVFNTSYEDDYNSGVFLTSQSTTGKYAIGYGDGSYNYISSSRRNFIGNSSIETNKWHFLTFIIRSSLDMEFYIDGVKVDGLYYGSGSKLGYSNMPGVIGKHDQSNILNAYYFKGLINDFKYWNRALSENEVMFLYSSYFEQDILSNNYVSKLESSVELSLVNSILSLKSKFQINKIEIYTILGQQLYSGVFSKEINLENYDEKVLVLKFQDELGHVFFEKIIR